VKLSIVTVNYRSWGHLDKALTALATGFPDEWEMIVVDNESEPASLDKFSANYPWVSFVANSKNSGFGFGCRIGVNDASGEQLLFMNPDVIASCDDIQRLIDEKRKHSDVAIIAPGQLDAGGRVQKVFDDFPNLLNQSKLMRAVLRILFPRSFPDPRSAYDQLTYCDWVTGSFLLIDRDDYDTIGGWSEDYWMYVEDADLCRKAHEAGMRVAYAPNVQVIHAHGGSSRLNVAVKSMTKLEVIISKHVYTARHTRGVERWITHTLIIALRLPMLITASVADILTFRQIPTLRVRSNILIGLLKHYAGVARSGLWISPRARDNQEA